VNTGRTIIVGDVHGCRAELDALLDRLAFTTGDRLVFVGDLVSRGPDSLGVLAVARRTGAHLVLGNHEAKLVAWRRAKPEKRKDLPISRHHAQIAESLAESDWALLANAPLWLDFPEHDLRVVHAGLVPGVPMDRQLEKNLLHMRCLTLHGEASDEKWGSAPLWGTQYVGSPHVVFGHNAMGTVQLHGWATGIDTGCVYGGALTSLVLHADEKLPRGAAVRELLHQQRAFAIHFEPGKVPGAKS
jgi:hypothetical protein